MYRALVTGSGGGIGRECVLALRRMSWEVHGWDRRNHNNPADRVVDVTSAQQCGEAAVVFGQKPLDLVICAHGVNRICPISHLGASVLEEHMRANAFSLVNIFQAVQPNLSQSQRATVCNVTSVAGSVPMTHSLAYNASKAAANMITRQMAHELGGHNKSRITIFGVAPGLVNSPMTDRMWGQIAKARGWSVERAKAYQKTKMSGGMIEPLQLARFIVELCTARNDHLNGCIMEYGK